MWSRSFAKVSLPAALLLAGLVACRSLTNARAVDCRTTLRQGLRGTVVFLEGNLMPSPDLDPGAAAGQPVVREIAVYAPTTRRQVEETAPTFYTNIRTERMATATSDSTGCFQVSLPAGSYSLFVREGDRYFANRFDGDGVIFPVRVDSGEVTQVRIDIDHAAAY